VSCMTWRANPRPHQIDGAAVGGRRGPAEIIAGVIGATGCHELHGGHDAGGAAAGHRAAHRRGPGAYTRPRLVSTRAVSDAKHTLHTPYYPLTPPKHLLNNP